MIKLKHITVLALLSFIVFGFTNTEGDLSKEAVRSIQSELRKSMKDLKYDGSKVTYFETKRDTQYKEVEVVLFLRDNNHLFFNGDLAPGRVSLKIYDGPAHDENRLVLYEERNIANKTIVVSEEELLNRLRFYDSNPKKLRSVYVDYEISKSRRSERGAIVFAVGFEEKKN
jgi:hypothetical protein